MTWWYFSLESILELPTSDAAASNPDESSSSSGEKARSAGMIRCANAARHSTRPEPLIFGEWLPEPRPACGEHVGTLQKRCARA